MSVFAALSARGSAQPVIVGAHEQWSAAELLQRVQAIAGQLRATGAKTVALYTDNCPDWVAVDLACQLAQVCLVPLPTFFAASQRDHVLALAAVDHVIFAAGDPIFGALACAQNLAGSSALTLAPFPVRGAAVMPPGTGKITFTSGSTGNPKGVCLSHSQCLTVAQSLAQAIDVAEPRHLSILPLSTLLENIGGVYVPLLAGGSSVILSPQQTGMSGSSQLAVPALLAALDRYQPNILILVPQLLLLLEQAMREGWQPTSALQFVAVGGARVPAALLSRVRKMGLPVYEGYGLSECASVVCLNRPGMDRPGTSGQVLPHVQLALRQGEIIARGNSFLGYLNQPESWGQRQVATGDLGSIDEQGFVTVRGRSKNVLISSFGRNISPEWVESELLATGGLAQAVALGDERPYCVALVSPMNITADTLQIQQLIDRANRQLPDYARVQRWYRLPQPLSFQAGSLTSNQRPRRDVIARQYANEIDRLYQLEETSCL